METKRNRNHAKPKVNVGLIVRVEMKGRDRWCWEQFALAICAQTTAEIRCECQDKGGGGLSYRLGGWPQMCLVQYDTGCFICALPPRRLRSRRKLSRKARKFLAQRCLREGQGCSHLEMCLRHSHQLAIDPGGFLGACSVVLWW